MPLQRFKALEYDLPVPAAVSRKMVARKSLLAKLSKLTEQECREELAFVWKALEHPANRTIAKFILSMPQVCIAECQDGYWLTFFSKSGRVSIVSPQHTSFPSNLGFPVESVPGLRELVTFFGGMTDFNVPPGSCFVLPAELHVANAADRRRAYYNIGSWDGSLLFYQGGSGDALMVRPDGAVGKWFHEFAIPESHKEQAQQMKDGLRKTAAEFPKINFDEAIRLSDCPVLDLACDLSTLLQSYPKYCKMAAGSKKREVSPFYY